jgi:putative transposase
MPNYRRAFVPGASYFFTVVTEGRAPILTRPPAPDLLRRSIRTCLDRWPFVIDAFVLLPDHVHSIWTLPPGDSDYSRRWSWIKRSFAKGWLARGGEGRRISPSRREDKRFGVWQRRFWEHVLRDEADFERHHDYIHFNPVKHGIVDHPRDWPYSSFHRAVRRGDYPEDWGRGAIVRPSFDDIVGTAPE